MLDRPLPIATSLALACSFLSILAGCDSTHLDALPKSLLAYNEARDEFHHVRSYSHITATRAARGEEGKPNYVSAEARRTEALDYLASLWKNREDVILWPNFLSPAGAEEIQILVVGSREYRLIPLGSKVAAPKIESVPFDLDRVRVIPGEFFLSPQKTLCYHQGCVVPGAVVDDLLAAVSKEGNDKALDQLAKLRQDRAAQKEMRISWAALRENCVKGKKSTERLSALSEFVGKHYQALDDDSIRLLIRQTSGNEALASRKGSVLSYRFQVSPADAQEFVAGFQRILSDNLPPPERGKNPDAKSDENAQAVERFSENMAAAFGRALKVTADSKGWIEISLDLKPILTAFNASSPGVPAWPGTIADEEELRHAQEDAASLEERRIPVNKTLTFEEVERQFRARAEK